MVRYLEDPAPEPMREPADGEGRMDTIKNDRELLQTYTVRRVYPSNQIKSLSL